MANYGKPDYWEQRYLKDPDPFDWYQRYSNNPHLRNLIDKTVPRAAAILVPGCGSSRLSEDMLADGYTGLISNIDISRTAIDLMADRCRDRASLVCAFYFHWRNSCSHLARPAHSFFFEAAWQESAGHYLQRTHAHTHTRTRDHLLH